MGRGRHALRRLERLSVDSLWPGACGCWRLPGWAGMLAAFADLPDNGPTMALKATIFKAELNISDMDRGYYASHPLTIARHPSENDERMMLRVAAFALRTTTIKFRPKVAPDLKGGDKRLTLSELLNPTAVFFQRQGETRRVNVQAQCVRDCLGKFGQGKGTRPI